MFAGDDRLELSGSQRKKSFTSLIDNCCFSAFEEQGQAPHAKGIENAVSMLFTAYSSEKAESNE